MGFGHQIGRAQQAERWGAFLIDPLFDVIRGKDYMSIARMLGITYPIIQGAMAQIAYAELAAAVSNAGGLGVIASGGMSADRLREEIHKCKSLTAKPFGVNLMLMAPNRDELAQLVIDEGVKVVTTGAGSPKNYVAMWKAAGIVVIPVVPSVQIARKMEALGVDAIVAEGTEAGGHVGETTTMVLVPQVADAVAIPVIAAGGIADGRGAARLLHWERKGCRWAHASWRQSNVRPMSSLSRPLLPRKTAIRW